MNDKSIEILLVEDNPNDEMLALHAFKKHNLANKVHVVRDGAEALEFVFCTGAYAGCRFENPRVILLDKKLPLVDGMEVLRQIREDPGTRAPA
jgi:two-component system response regulator